MRIATIFGENFQGGSFKVDLSPVTLLWGRNFAGKTRVVNAAVAAMTGAVPGVASRPNELYDYLATGPAMAAGVALDDGGECRRAWRRERGSVKCTSTSTEPLLPPEAVDLQGEFLDLSARDRVRFLFRRGTLPDEFQVAKMRAALVAAAKDAVLADGNTPESEEALRAVAADLGGFGSDAQPAQAWVEELVAHVDERKKSAAASQERMEHTQQGLSQSAADGAAPPPLDAEAVLERARKAHGEASVALHLARQGAARAEDEAREAEDAGRRLAAERAPDVAALEKALADAPDPGPEPQAVARPPQPPAPDYGPVAEAREAWAKAGTVRDARRDRVRELAQELEEARTQTKCPTCGQSVAKLKAKLAKSVKENMAAAEKALAESVAEFERAGKAVNKATDIYDAQKAALVAWTDRAAKLDQEEESAHTAWSRKARARREASDAVLAARARLAGRESLAASAARAPALRAAADAARAKVPTAERAAAEAEGAVRAAEDGYRRLTQGRAEEAARARARAELARARVEARAWKEVQKGVGQLQAKLTAAAVGPIVTLANELCGGILRAPLALEGGELVMANGSGVGGTSHRSFSGTERALSYCALTVALAAASKAKIRLAVFDEVGRLDAANREKLVGAMVGLVKAGKLDQAVLLGTESIVDDQTWGGGLYREVEVK